MKKSLTSQPTRVPQGRSRSTGVPSAKAQSSSTVSGSHRRTSSVVDRGSHADRCEQVPADVAYDVVLCGRVFVGTSWTGSPSEFVECVAFSRRYGIICFVGSRDALLAQTIRKDSTAGVLHRADWCRTYDVTGLVVPAFHDAHCHPFGAGNRERRWNQDINVVDTEIRKGAVDLSGCASWSDVAARIQSVAACTEAGNSAGEVIFAEGCDPVIGEEIRLDAAQRLEACGGCGRPVVVVFGDPAEAVAASPAAIALLPSRCAAWNYPLGDHRIERSHHGACGGGKRAEGRQGGKMNRNPGIEKETGSPTGYFRSGVWAGRFSLLSRASLTSQGVRGLLDGLRELPREGIVSCTDAFVFSDRVSCYEAAFEEDVAVRRLPRVSLAIGFKDHWTHEKLCEELECAVAMRRTWKDTGYRYCLQEAKVEVDHCMWSTNRGGSCSWDYPLLEHVVRTMVQADFSVHFHVFGDLAARHSLQLLSSFDAPAISAAGSQSPSPRRVATAVATETNSSGRSRDTTNATTPRRHKIAHVFELLPEEIDILDGMRSVFVVYQPLWFSKGEKAEQAQQHQELLRRGASVCYGSDWDITALSPMEGIQKALDIDGAFDAKIPWRQRVATALRLYTLESARAMWMEDNSGSLEVGKMADICILDRDIFEMDEAELRQADGPAAKVVATFSNGVCLFRRDTEVGAPPVLNRSRSQFEDSMDTAKQAVQISEVFRKFDDDGDGTISREELARVLTLLDTEEWTDEALETLFKHVDVGKDGKIDVEEFARWVTLDDQGRACLQRWQAARALDDDFLCGTCGCAPIPLPELCSMAWCSPSFHGGVDDGSSSAPPIAPAKADPANPAAPTKPVAPTKSAPASKASASAKSAVPRSGAVPRRGAVPSRAAAPAKAAVPVKAAALADTLTVSVAKATPRSSRVGGMSRGASAGRRAGSPRV
eukprot:TRINITY_DN23027_c0_g1_i1.p1 TRINITY_DN23027_c0_g1~~TRINITY_DN23027_c0_g1_i1.p1  ORF type:complete len:950 (+),score=158.40 TRINITY_DN23027_c0_g1_i1:36-2852(+)